MDGIDGRRQHGDGVTITDSTGDTIGGTAAADRNVISGNGGNGITLNGSSGSTIEGNYIGTDATGALARPTAATAFSSEPLRPITPSAERRATSSRATMPTAC